MKRAELVAEVADRIGMTKKDTDQVLDCILTVIGDTLAQGENVQFQGFGTFELRQRAARTGRHPVTGEPIRIPAACIPSFKPGKTLKEKIEQHEM
ncbi:MAG: HU family DNA-binding protein [Butyricicoccaceae bacterium]